MDANRNDVVFGIFSENAIATIAVETLGNATVDTNLGSGVMRRCGAQIC